MLIKLKYTSFGMNIVESGIDTTVIKQSSKGMKINKHMFCCVIYFTDGAAFHVGSAISSGEMEQKFLAFSMPF
jgi:hypothetical protein